MREFLPTMARNKHAKRGILTGSHEVAAPRALRVPVSKSGIRFHRIGGSNPPLSASLCGSFLPQA